MLKNIKTEEWKDTRREDTLLYITREEESFTYEQGKTTQRIQ